ncbi:MAG: hypothetical protein RIQ56_450 [Candidatus Parcubacteria bacterium]|jgi:GTP-binding protein
MFLDEATIDVSGGAGGRGCVAWRREKYIPMGGPNGGDGGKGGDAILLADENTDTLSDYSSTKRFEAKKGGFGRGQNCAGKDGEDLILRVPPGTVIFEIENSKSQIANNSKISNLKSQLITELLNHGDRIVVARGGRGGYGNAHFKTATRQRPDFAELGEPGERKKLRLELKLVADVGIIGYPSVGKSTLISVISQARPKIGDYPFTTLVPNLGVVQVSDRYYVVCDVPGLIEGASEGKGLGHQFLRHIERCGVLVHLLDISRAFPEGVISGDPDPALLTKDYEAIRTELKAYSPTLAKKRELVILNKTDLIGNDAATLEKQLKKSGIEIFMSISSATKTNTADLTKALLPIVLEEREKRMENVASEEKEQQASLPVLRPHLESSAMGAYRIEEQGADIHIRGRRLEQFTAMTDFGSEGGVQRFRDVLDKIGLLRALKKMRGDEERAVYIGAKKVDPYL